MDPIDTLFCLFFVIPIATGALLAQWINRKDSRCRAHDHAELIGPSINWEKNCEKEI
jgi:hypothetical protein